MRSKDQRKEKWEMIKSAAVSSILFSAVFFAAVWSVSEAGNIYKWVDKDGGIHFTNKPPPEGVTVLETMPEMESDEAPEPAQGNAQGAVSPPSGEAEPGPSVSESAEGETDEGTASLQEGEPEEIDGVIVSDPLGRHRSGELTEKPREDLPRP
jgi:hypothetical protein